MSWGFHGNRTKMGNIYICGLQSRLAVRADARWVHLDVDRSRSGAELLLLLGWRRSRSSRLLSEGEPLRSLLPGERDLDEKVGMKINTKALKK